MSWYSDAFKSNMGNVNIKNISSNSGSEFKEFGDAFKDIGKSMVESGDATQKKELRDIQVAEAKQKAIDNELLSTALSTKDKTVYQNTIDAKNKQLQKDYEAKKAEYDDRIWTKPFVSEPQKPTDIKLSAEAQSKADKIFQDNFNNEAIKTAFSGKYTTSKDFADNNSELIKYADGKTIAEINDKLDNPDKKLKGIQIQNLEKAQEEKDKASAFYKDAFGITDTTQLKEIAKKHGVDGKILIDLDNTNKSNDIKLKEYRLKEDDTKADIQYKKDKISVDKESNRISSTKTKTEKPEKVKIDQKDIIEANKQWFGYGDDFDISTLNETQKKEWNKGLKFIGDTARKLNITPLETLGKATNNGIKTTSNNANKSDPLNLFKK